MTKKMKLVCLVANCLLAIMFLAGGVFFSFASEADVQRVTESVENAQITQLNTQTSDWTVLGGGTTVSDGMLTTSSEAHDWNTAAAYNTVITTDAIQFELQSYGTLSDNENMNTMWTVRAELGKGGDFAQFTGYHIVLYPNSGWILCITNPDIAIRGDTFSNPVDLKNILFDGEKHTVVVGATDRADGVYVFLDVDGENIWNFTDTLVDGKPRIAKENTAFCVGHRNVVENFCEQLNYTVTAHTEGSEPAAGEPTVTDPENITVLDTETTSDWAILGEGTTVSGGMLTTSSDAHDWNTAAAYTPAITTDAIQFELQSYGTLSDNENMNTMWTVRAARGQGGDFAQFTGYHIVLYPNSGKILCITNPNIAEYGAADVDLKNILFDGEKHTVVVGAIDRADGVYIFLDVDGENVWNFTDALVYGKPRIAKENTAFCIGHRNVVASFCEQLNYYINYREFVMPEYDVYELKTTDFTKNNWEFYQNIAVADESLISNSGDTHAMAK